MPDARGYRTYFETITAAVADIAEHGYDSQERIDFWAEEIRRAAERSMKSMNEIERMVRDAMAAVFQRQVTNLGVLKLNPGVTAYTLERIKPELHAELSRRIAASIDLIKINRPQAIAKTQQRFRGWATSVPPGGTPKTGKAKLDKVKQKVELRKSLARLPFEERRVIIDQNAKLFSAINTTVAVNGGAIGAFWHSHKLQRGYDGRPAHNARDGKFFLVRDSWAKDAGLVKANRNGYTDDIEQPGEFVYCFPGDSPVPYADGVTVGYRHFYSGKLTEIVTGSGKTIRATPNHPVLTSKGWIAIDLLEEGDDVIEIFDNLVTPAKLNNDDAVPTIAQIFGTLEEFGISKTVAGSLQSFHGDGPHGNIDTVRTAWPLTFGRNAKLVERGPDFYFAMSFLERTSVRATEFFFVTCFAAFPGLVCRLSKAAAAFCAFMGHAKQRCLAAASGIMAGIDKALAYDAAAGLEPAGNGQNTVSGHKKVDDGRNWNFNFEVAGGSWAPVESKFASPGKKRRGLDSHDLGDFVKSLPFVTKATKVVKINRSSWSGHVYNLETANGSYAVDGIIVSNCKCSYQYVFSLRSVPDDCMTDKGREALAEARRKVANAA